ncbi:ABC transporter substrate-binding protein [Streptomyces albipurpureus]|uniref:ABC transporter substrate-binding protein n=1 Tax=Streptomyces albipurpureus TaxID=2897419 RepID=A0ABT0UQI1_9ACTN|nr:ABC transporter substrate-binding protein [Streptomyces sp. CWNU-1]MCM2389501.1 ABC transporter substrate-binding protein [Streptomyces sp. CWNU-1]
MSPRADVRTPSMAHHGSGARTAVRDCCRNGTLPGHRGTPDTRLVRNELTRRGFGRGVGALTLGGLLVACGSDGNGSGGATGAGAKDGGTIDFSYQGYRAKIPADPQRVVALDPRTGMEFAVMAGYPIIAGYRLEKGNHLATRVPAGFKALEGNETEPSAESVLAQEPDLLVIGEDWWKFYQEKKLLTEDIAPVLVVGGGFSPFWRRHTEQQLTLLGREQQARKQLTAYDTRLATAKKEVGRLIKGKKVLIAGAENPQFWAQTRSFYLSVANELGMDVMFYDPERDISSGKSNEYHSLEQVDAFAPADLIILQNPDDPATRAKTWQRLPAVRAGRVAPLNYYSNAGLALTATALLDELVSAAKLLG